MAPIASTAPLSTAAFVAPRVAELRRGSAHTATEMLRRPRTLHNASRQPIWHRRGDET